MRDSGGERGQWSLHLHISPFHFALTACRTLKTGGFYVSKFGLLTSFWIIRFIAQTVPPVSIQNSVEPFQLPAMQTVKSTVESKQEKSFMQWIFSLTSLLIPIWSCSEYAHACNEHQQQVSVPLLANLHELKIVFHASLMFAAAEQSRAEWSLLISSVSIKTLIHRTFNQAGNFLDRAKRENCSEYVMLRVTITFLLLPSTQS